MALMNQLPRMTNRSIARDLPEWAGHWAFGIAVASFIGLVALRAPLLNHRGDLVGLGILGMLVIAFMGGLAFKGRSGWCGTFCPLGPIQRDYGHAPLVMVRNGFCSTCVGCQKNCYDFNPRAAVFGDIYDNDAAYAGQRRFFMAMMPGTVLGYFLQAPNPDYSEPLRALISWRRSPPQSVSITLSSASPRSTHFVLQICSPALRWPLSSSLRAQPF